MIKIAIIGVGNMGASLLGGLCQHGFSANHIWITDPYQEKLSALQKTYHVNIAPDNHEAAANANVIILAVKPQIMHDVCKEIAASLTKNTLIISIAAGITLANLTSWLGNDVAIVRVMPNTAALIGASASALCANGKITKEQQQTATNILQAVGTAIWLDKESDIDTVTALSGSGPAYFYLMIESLENAACQLGLTKDIAHQLAVQTAYGAARMASEMQDDIITLRHKVTSPGGTTEKAIQVLEENNIRNIFLAALTAAKKRSQELAKKTE